MKFPVSIAAHPTISIVVPCYNEEAVLPEFAERLSTVMNQLGATYEVVLVDDGSNDRTAEVARSLCVRFKGLQLVSLFRNFGHQNAVTAGLEQARGDGVVLIDADLQDPPEVIPEMVARWREGYQVVYGQRRRRDGETFFKRISAKMFYRFLSWITQAKIARDTGDFRLMDRTVVNVLRSMPEQHRFIRGMVGWIGGRQIAVVYDRKARKAGATKYSLAKMLLFATDAITGFSVVPLRLVTGLGAVTVSVSLMYAAFILVMRIFAPAYYVPGWPTVAILILFFGGLNMFCVGLVGEYIGRIFEEMKGRPKFVVASVYPQTSALEITDKSERDWHSAVPAEQQYAWK